MLYRCFVLLLYFTNGLTNMGANYTLTTCLSIPQVGAQLRLQMIQFANSLTMCMLLFYEIVIVNKSMSYEPIFLNLGGKTCNVG